MPTDDAKSLQVLLLHGASFTSETWTQIGTFQLLSAMKYRVVALDIPGKSETCPMLFVRYSSMEIKNTDFFGGCVRSYLEGEFPRRICTLHKLLKISGYGKSQGGSDLKLEDFIGAVNLDRPVIVSPSMSGGHSLPYIFSDADTWTHRVRGYIPVAPVGTSRFQADVYKRCQVS